MVPARRWFRWRSCVLLQLAAIYYFTYANRTGATWKAGTALHYLLHQDRMVTTLGLWLRERMSLGTSQALTWATLALRRRRCLVLTPWPGSGRAAWRCSRCRRFTSARRCS